MLALLALVAVLVVPVAILTSATYAATSSLRRANRVVPSSRTVASAPLWWLWSPGPLAMLHRRLRSACELASSVAGSLAPARSWPRRQRQAPVDGIAELAREVLQEAVLLDREVVAASRLGRGMTRTQALGALDYQVRGVEDAARRVHQLATRRAQLARQDGPVALSLDQRISAMEEALNELTPPPTA